MKMILTVLFSAGIILAQSYNVSFTEYALQKSKSVTENETNFEIVAMQGLNNEGEPGYPLLPVRYIRLIIPTEQDVSNVTVSPKGETEHILNFKIFPAQPDMLTAVGAVKPAFVGPKKEIYESNEPYPKQLVKVVDHGFFDGANHIVTLAVYPAQYLPKSNLLKVCSSVDFSLEFEQTKGKPIFIQNRTESSQKMYDDMLEGMVYNKNEIPQYKAQHNIISNDAQSGLMKRSSNIDYYDYVIITDNTLKNGFDRFVDWKKRKGVDIGVVTVDEITAAGFVTDLQSGITDTQGGIREYLQNAWSLNGTVWALLGGDYNHVDVRYGCGSNNTWDYTDNEGNVHVNGNKIPADVYYSEFNGDWKVDVDDFYGES